MGKSKIEWTDHVWNPVTGCTKVSAGCAHCYAERLFTRVYKKFGVQPDGDLRYREFTDVRCHPERLEQPLHWRKPRRIFVNSMSDLFQEAVPWRFIEKVIGTMLNCPHHTFQILTKRPKRMLELLTAKDECGCRYIFEQTTWIWWGVSVEDQATADERIPLLLQTPAAVRFVSYEPALGPLKLSRLHAWCPEHDFAGGFCSSLCPSLRKPDWLICGGESGPKARPLHPDWARSVRDQCQAAGIPYFFKQWGDICPVSQLSSDAFNYVFHGGIGPKYNDDNHYARVGKKRAGHLLDGQEHREWPCR